MTLEEVMNTELSNKTKTAVVKICKLVRNFVTKKDIEDCEEDQEAKLTIEKLRVLQQSWSNLKKVSLLKTGQLVYKHMFEISPSLLRLFPFKDQKDFLQSAQLKTQSANVVSSIGRVIENLEEFDLSAAFLIALGQEHRKRGVKTSYFDIIEAAVYKALEEVNEPHFEPVVQDSWRPLFSIISKKMMEDNYDHLEDLEFLNQNPSKQKGKQPKVFHDFQINSPTKEKSHV